jgi:hypothetical protein
MNKLLFLIILPFMFSGFVASEGSNLVEGLKPLEKLIGTWDGSGKGPEGPSAVSRKYEVILKGHFIEMTNRALFNPARKNPSSPHEDLGIFSYDRDKKKIIFRHFVSEGFMNQYIVTVSKDGRIITMETESIENLAVEHSTRYEIIFTGLNGFSEKFYVSSSGKKQQCLITNEFERYKE